MEEKERQKELREAQVEEEEQGLGEGHVWEMPEANVDTTKGLGT